MAAVGILAIGAFATGWYNRSITGDPFVLPHVAYDRQYTPVPNFRFESERAEPPRYGNAEMAFAYRSTYVSHYRRLMSPGGLWRELERRCWS